MPGRSRQQALVESRNKTIGQALFHRMSAQEILTDEQSNHWVKRLPVVLKVINAHQKDRAKKKVSNSPFIPKDTVMLSIGQPVRVQLDKPIDIVSYKRLHGDFRATDIRWSRKISKVTNIIIDDNNPILYQVDNKHSPAYTYNQQQVVDVDNLEDPPASEVMEGTPSQYIVKEIVDKKKEKNKIYYRIRWKGYPLEKDITWEPKTELVKNPLLKDFIDAFEEKHN